MPELRPRVSYAELRRRPDDGRRFELYGGELVEMPAPSFGHQRAVVKLVAALAAYEAPGRGAVVAAPFDLVLSPFDVLQPDVMFFAAGPARQIDRDGAAHVAPALVIEVLSARTTATDRGPKMRLLARGGVPEYWLVDVEQATIEQYVLASDGFVLHAVASGDEPLVSVALAGFSVPPAHVCGAD
jgi:Uma2 family endonuclease